MVSVGENARRARSGGGMALIEALAPWLFLAMGLGFLAFGIRDGLRTRAFIARAERTTGTVISGRSTPVVRFETADGVSHTFRGRVSSNPPAFDVGEQVEVLYDPADPGDARLRGPMQLWFGFAVVSLLGAIFALIGCGQLTVRALGARARARLRRGAPPRPARPRRPEGESVLTKVMLLFLGGGLLFLSIGVLDLRRSQALAAGRERAMGRVIAIEHGRPMVRYRAADGVERTVEDTRNEDFPPSVGDEVPVLYLPADPRVASVRTSGDLWGLGIGFAAMGGAFAALGGGVLLVRAARSFSRGALRRRGRLVHARLVRVERNVQLEVNGAHPWRIVCTWTDPATGRQHLLRSQNLWRDPRPALAGRMDVPWFVDPRDPRRHVVDLGFLERPV
jgi:hypothetical protein